MTDTTTPAAAPAATPPAVATIYNTQTGEIVGWGSYAANVSHKHGLYDSIPGQFDGAAYYIDLKATQAVVRPSMGISLDKTSLAADGKDTATFAGVPAGVMLQLDAQPAVAVLDGSVAFTAVNPGTYAFAFTLFPYVPLSFQVVAK